jgi:hypothetical protein
MSRYPKHQWKERCSGQSAEVAVGARKSTIVSMCSKTEMAMRPRALVVILCHRHVGRIGGTSFDPVYSLGWGTGPGVGRWCDAEVRHGGELGGGWAVSCEIER